jgi:CO/xanthine dehydrogenase Mo-binding subunit
VTVSVSGAERSAAEGARAQLLALAAGEFEAHVDDLELVSGQVQVKGVPERGIGVGRLAQLAQSRAGGPGPIVAEGRASMKAGAPSFIAQLVRVRVDAETGQVTVLEMVAIQDVGFAMNPLLVEGQVHGGNVQAVGYGLFEAMRFDDSGGLSSSNFLNYALPRALDLPSLEAILVQHPSKNGPFGARVVGEPPITSAASALVNAIRDAVGVRVTEMPVTPEGLWRAMRDRA